MPRTIARWDAAFWIRFLGMTSLAPFRCPRIGSKIPFFAPSGTARYKPVSAILELD